MRVGSFVCDFCAVLAVALALLSFAAAQFVLCEGIGRRTGGANRTGLESRAAVHRSASGLVDFAARRDCVRFGGHALCSMRRGAMRRSTAGNRGGERNRRASDSRAFFGFTYFAAIVITYVRVHYVCGGDWSVGRFFVPILAFAYVLIAAGLYWMVSGLVHMLRHARRGTVPLAAALAILLAIPLWFASGITVNSAYLSGALTRAGNGGADYGWQMAETKCAAGYMDCGGCGRTSAVFFGVARD